MTDKSIKKKRSYHHGNLRASLIAAAVEVIAEREQASFTLRELARRLGVTHAATYHHFRDKDDLLGAVALDGFERLLANSKKAIETLKSEDNTLQMRQIAASYIRFALEHPGHFRVMYRMDYSKEPERYGATLEALESYQQYGRAFWELAYDAGIYRTDVPKEELNTASWAILHGLAMLHISGLLHVEDDISIEEYSSRITRHMYVGIGSAQGRARASAAQTL